MDTGFAAALIINASLLLSISIIYNMLFYSLRKRGVVFSILLGLVAGLLGMFLMMNSVKVAPDIIFDTRSILVSVSGLFFGFIPTIIAVVIICVYRIIIGGSGQIVGVLVTVLTAGFGLLWHHFRFEKLFSKNKNIWLDFYLFSLITHVIMLACFFTLPREHIAAILSEITLPILVIYPVASTILCMVIFFVFNNIQTETNLAESELRFRAMFEQAPIGITISKKDETLYYNAMFEKITGRTREEIISNDWERYTHPDDLQEDKEKLLQLISGIINDYSMVKRYFKPDGEIVWVNMTVTALRIDNQLNRNYLCMIQDITQIKKSENDLKESEANYKKLYHEFQDKQVFLQSLLNAIPDLIFYKDTDGIYRGCNKAFEELAGTGHNNIIGHSDYELFSRDTADQFLGVDAAMKMQQKERVSEDLVTYPDGRKVFLETVMTPYYDSNGNVSGLIGASRDVTERKTREEEILYLNYHDVLTGIYNRTFFDKEIIRLDAADQLPLSVIIGDINGLKFVNDAFGHAEGDAFLVEMARILVSCCGEKAVIARTGGDEFSILLPRTDSSISQSIVDQIKKACGSYGAKTDKEIYETSISLGHATKTKDDESLDEVKKIAEEFMYRHKLLEHKSLHSAIISSIKTTMFEKSNETEEHAERMAELSKKLGKVLNFSEDDLVSLELVTTLHDIGKISIDQRILDKPGKLTEEEWIEIRKHPDVGYRIALTVPELSRIAEYILCHHERWDGNGYPQGLHGKEIPVISRILSIIDSYDAMTQDRSYRKAMSKDAAIIEIRQNAGTQFDPELSEIFIDKVLPYEG
ncbi:MAG: PAS domain S-box protein [Eubacteriales bacterium]